MQEMYKLEGTVLTVVLPQDVDHPVTDLVRRETDHIINQNYIRKIVFDFTHTEFMDSSGVGLLMGRYRAMGMRKESIQAVGVSRHIDRLLPFVGSASLYRNSESRGGRSMKENTNEMILVFDSMPVNEGLARITAASFCTQLNPTLEEVADLKTAVSEAVTNCIIHGYEGEINKIEMKLQYHRSANCMCILQIMESESRTLRRRWNRCIRRSRTMSARGWDLPLWRHLWMRYV